MSPVWWDGWRAALRDGLKSELGLTAKVLKLNES
jgi:hypothetical protein